MVLKVVNIELLVCSCEGHERTVQRLFEKRKNCKERLNVNCLKAKFKLKHHTASDKAGLKPWNKTSAYLLTVVHLQRHR